MREIQQLGKSLTCTEMKNIAGRVPPQTLWRCFIDGSWYADLYNRRGLVIMMRLGRK